CTDCSSAFFSQKLLNQHKRKCTAAGSKKTRFTVSVRMPDEEVAEVARSAAAQQQVDQAVEESTVAASPQAADQQQQQEEQRDHQQEQPPPLPAVHLSIGDAENVSPAGGGGGVAVRSAVVSQQQQQHHTRLLRADIPLRSPVDRRRVACNACGKMFTGARCCNWLADHLRIEHLDQPPHACPHCGALFVYFDTLQEHVTANHGSDGSRAVVTAGTAGDSGSSDAKQQQEQAEASAGEGYAYCCGLCNETYTDLPLLLKHFSDLHPEFASQDELVAAATAPLQQQQQQILYACTLCSQSFDQLMSGQLHLQRNHPNEWRQIVCCPVCQLNCKTESLNKTHIWSVHTNPKSLPEGPVPCRLCVSARVQQLGNKSAQEAAMFAGPEQLYEHYTAVHSKPMSAFIVETTAAAVAAGGDTLYECGGCKARYKDRMLLEAHFQAGCPSLAASSSEAQLTDAVDDAAYLQSSVLTA
ncbi:hypothetical protein BOX15_Mlig025179g1, partial [Macrostomum lignano]